MEQLRDLDGYVRNLAKLAVRAARCELPAISFSDVGFARSTMERIERLDDKTRNRGTKLSLYAIGGASFMFAIVAFALQTLAPTLAFAGQAPATQSVAVASCSDSPARIINPVMPEFPEMAKNLPKTSYQAMVIVRVSSSGYVLSTKVSASSGHSDIDVAAVAAAASTYKLAMQCKQVAGTYMFRAIFNP